MEVATAWEANWIKDMFERPQALVITRLLFVFTSVLVYFSSCINQEQDPGTSGERLELEGTELGDALFG